MGRERETEPTKAPSLLVSSKEAARLLDERIEKGSQLRDIAISSQDQLNRERADYSKWNQYNKQLLRKIFDTDSIAIEYGRSIGFAVIGAPTFYENLKRHRDDIQNKLDRLDSIKERLELFDEINTYQLQNPVEEKNEKNNNKVFIVHGHDQAVKLDVARTLEKLGLEAIILHEKPNAGQTIIEKLEANSDVGFAVILLTPDDEGKAKADNQFNARARQNVVAELGYFIGKLGRGKVCPLYVNGVEVPSDFSGVAYVLVDLAGNWRFELTRELKAAGYKIDANSLLG